MKKLFFILTLFFSVGMVAQESCDVEVKRVITKSDLPIGKTFVLKIDGYPTLISGKIDKELLGCLPIGKPFTLSIDGVVTKYNLYPLPPKGKEK